MKKQVLAIAPVTHSCQHTVNWEFYNPETEAERVEITAELERLALEHCPECKEKESK